MYVPTCSIPTTYNLYLEPTIAYISGSFFLDYIGTCIIVLPYIPIVNDCIQGSEGVGQVYSSYGISANFRRASGTYQESSSQIRLIPICIPRVAGMRTRYAFRLYMPVGR